MTHAGYLSFEESLCHCVPMVVTPICYDQFANADEVVKLGIGKSVKFTDITVDNLTEALSEVINICALYTTALHSQYPDCEMYTFLGFDKPKLQTEIKANWISSKPLERNCRSCL